MRDRPLLWKIGAPVFLGSRRAQLSAHLQRAGGVTAVIAGPEVGWRAEQGATHLN